MNKLENINSILNINSGESGFYDYNYKKDNKVFFDEIKIDCPKDNFAMECRKYISAFWSKFLELLTTNRKDSKDFFEKIKEINWTCMGYSNDEPKGRGISGKLSKKIYKAISNMSIFKNAKVHHLVEMEIFVDYVNADRISDIITSIILLPLSKYTENICKKYGLINFLITEKDCRIWDADKKDWTKRDIKVLDIDGRKRLLYPKNIVAEKPLYKKEDFFSTFMIKEIRNIWLNEKRHLVKTRKYRNNTIQYIPRNILLNEINKCAKESGLTKNRWIIKMFNDGVLNSKLIHDFYSQRIDKHKNIKNIKKD